MSADADDLQPTQLEVLQSELPANPTEPSVPVHLVGTDVPVRTQQLPHKGGATFTKLGVGTTPMRVLPSDHKRARAVITSIGGNFYIAFTSAAAQDPSRMALQVANTPFPVTHDGDVWVAAATGTVSISVATELWALGDSSL